MIKIQLRAYKGITIKRVFFFIFDVDTFYKRKCKHIYRSSKFFFFCGRGGVNRSKACKEKNENRCQLCSTINIRTTRKASL